MVLLEGILFNELTVLITVDTISTAYLSTLIQKYTILEVRAFGIPMEYCVFLTQPFMNGMQSN